MSTWRSTCGSRSLPVAISSGGVAATVAVKVMAEREEHLASCQRRANPNPLTPKSPTRRPQWRQAALSQGLMARRISPQLSGTIHGTRRASTTQEPLGILASGWLAHTGPSHGTYSCSEIRAKGIQPYPAVQDIMLLALRG